MIIMDLLQTVVYSQGLPLLTSLYSLPYVAAQSNYKGRVRSACGAKPVRLRNLKIQRI